MIARLLTLCIALLLAGCDLDAMLADPKAVQKEADAKAIGNACRHGLRSIEDCYALNEKASKAAIFAGWKEMDQYMRENKIEGVEPKGLKPPPPPPAPKPTASDAQATEGDAAKGEDHPKAEVASEKSASSEADKKHASH